MYLSTLKVKNGRICVKNDGVLVLTVCLVVSVQYLINNQKLNDIFVTVLLQH